MYCPDCGRKLEDGMAFCPECGRKIEAFAAGGAMPDSSEIPITKDEAQALLEEILSSLSAKEREAIRLRYAKERTPAQIAEELGIPETEAKELLMRAQNLSESKILEMEKRGTKLYSLAPLPFLAMLFKAYGAEASGSDVHQKEGAESASEDAAKSSVENNIAKSTAENSAAQSAGARAAGETGVETAAGGAGTGAAASGVGAAGAAGQAAAGAVAAGAAAGISAKTVAIIAVIAAACVGGGALALTQSGSSAAKTIEEQWQEQYDAGLQYLEDEEYEEAVSAFSEAIELIEEEEDAWIGRGTAYALLGDEGSAAADCDAILSMEDLSAGDYIQTAEVYEILEDYEEALSVIEDGLLLYEEDEDLLAKQEDITQLFLTQQFTDLYLDENEGEHEYVSGAVKEVDRTAAEDETEDDASAGEAEELVFDTSAQIEETVIYDTGNIRVTAERLEYTEETVDLVFLVENNADETIMLLNGSAGDGQPWMIKVNGRYVFESDSLQFYSGTGIPAGESAELSLSISREELKWSGITAIAEIETDLWLADERGLSLDDTEIELDLFTSVRDTYDIGEEGFVLNVLGEAAQKTYGYQVLASDTEEMVYDGGYGDQVVVCAAALIEEDDGTIYLLIESEAYSYYLDYVQFYVNGILTDKIWDNMSGRAIYVEGDERCVLIFSLDPSECEEYGIDTVTSAKAVLSGTYGIDGLEAGDYVVELTAER